MPCLSPENAPPFGGATSAGATFVPLHIPTPSRLSRTGVDMFIPWCARLFLRAERARAPKARGRCVVRNVGPENEKWKQNVRQSALTRHQTCPLPTCPECLPDHPVTKCLSPSLKEPNVGSMVRTVQYSTHTPPIALATNELGEMYFHRLDEP